MDVMTVRENGSFEFTEKKSVFISRAFFVRDEEDVASALEEIKKAHPEAKHHVWAYALSSGAKRFTDDGEPSGTAGMPVLKVIEMSGLQDVFVVVTRYFGGILLGAGGLTRAYTRSTAGVLEASGRARIVEVVPFEITCGYEYHRSVQKPMQARLYRRKLQEERSHVCA